MLNNWQEDERRRRKVGALGFARNERFRLLRKATQAKFIEVSPQDKHAEIWKRGYPPLSGPTSSNNRTFLIETYTKESQPTENLLVVFDSSRDRPNRLGWALLL